MVQPGAVVVLPLIYCFLLAGFTLQLVTAVVSESVGWSISVMVACNVLLIFFLMKINAVPEIAAARRSEVLTWPPSAALQILGFELLVIAASISLALFLQTRRKEIESDQLIKALQPPPGLPIRRSTQMNSDRSTTTAQPVTNRIVTDRNAGPTKPLRIDYLDNLRAIAMLLGVYLHAGLAYANPAQTIWLATDSRSSILVDASIWLIHLFRLSLFFCWLAILQI